MAKSSGIMQEFTVMAGIVVALRLAGGIGLAGLILFAAWWLA